MGLKFGLYSTPWVMSYAGFIGTGDITDTWESMKDIGFEQGKWAKFAGPSLPGAVNETVPPPGLHFRAAVWAEAKFGGGGIEFPSSKMA